MNFKQVLHLPSFQLEENHCLYRQSLSLSTSQFTMLPSVTLGVLNPP